MEIYRVIQCIDGKLGVSTKRVNLIGEKKSKDQGEEEKLKEIKGVARKADEKVLR